MVCANKQNHQRKPPVARRWQRWLSHSENPGLDQEPMRSVTARFVTAPVPRSRHGLLPYLPGTLRQCGQQSKHIAYKGSRGDSSQPYI
eukprot:596875-Pyramimonas_sp.AAC.1